MIKDNCEYPPDVDPAKANHLMSHVIHEAKKRDQATGILITSSVLITLFLGFIDEGYYNFNWMADIGNWIVLSVYGLVIFLFQYLIYRLLLKLKLQPWKILPSILLGTAVGIWVAVEFIFTN